MKTSTRPAVFLKSLCIFSATFTYLYCFWGKPVHFLTSGTGIKWGWMFGVSDRELLSQLNLELGIMLYNFLSKQHTFNVNQRMVFATCEDKPAVIGKKYMSWWMALSLMRIGHIYAVVGVSWIGAILLQLLNVIDECLRFSNNFSFSLSSFKPEELIKTRSTIIFSI